MYPKKFQDLIKDLNRISGVGGKTAERYAFALLDWDEESLDRLIDDLKGLKKIGRCKVCGNLSDGEICDYCSDPSRNKNLICVVTNPKDISAIESLGEYDGVYHVLNGAINTAKGILPEDLNIAELEKRIDEDTEEVILALDPTIEGETTSLYLSKLLQDKVKVSHLAQGIPMGGKLGYTDLRTLKKAFKARS